MGKYAKYQRSSTKVRPTPIHPIWRGIGCILWVVVPVLSYGVAYLVVRWVKPTGLIPAQLLGNPQFPANVYNLPIIGWIAQFISSITDLAAIACFFVIAVLILTGVATTLYAATYRWIGPARYSPVDAPPDRYKWGSKPRG
ncbi:MAG: hypothetical protein ABSB41_03700 [Anaerolineales bacterium]|jgi:hypothetical protein